jgi:hypothetical protein
VIFALLNKIWNKVKKLKEKPKESQALFFENENGNNHEHEEDEIDFVVRRKDALNKVLEKLIDKINEPIQEIKQTKSRFKQPKKG